MGRLAHVLGAALLALPLMFAATAGRAASALPGEALVLPGPPGVATMPALWFPATGSGRHPAVLGLHGCAGPRDAAGQWSGMWRRYAETFNAEGMSFLVIDSLAARGLGSLCGTRDADRMLDETGRRLDAKAALDWLAARDDVDASRLALVGWSHGAQTVLSAVDGSFASGLAVRPKAAVAFYPGCAKFAADPGYKPAINTLVMIGEKDDWTLAASCQRLAARVARPEAFTVVVYPGAYHGFDSRTPLKTLRSIGNTKSGTATYGENVEAREASRQRLIEFLSLRLR